MKRIRTRFAPSPTGFMHIGNIRTAFYAYALAKHEKGDFILRIEDTDKKRESVGGASQIKDLLKIFKIDWDEYYVQSERLSMYKKAAEKLFKEGHAFYCQCEARNAKEKYSKILRDPCRNKKLKSGALKLKVPENKKVTFTDFVIEKEVFWDTNTVADTTLLKSDGYPTYHLASVVDDNDMQITHVLRGHDWLPSTPIHLLVYKYLGHDLPQVGHLTDILDPIGGKLSKRKGSTSVKGLLDEGYLPEALFNFVILLGWAPKNNREFFSLEEFVKAFDSKGFQKSNPVFNCGKLDWFNGEYIRKMSVNQFNSHLEKFYGEKYKPDLISKVAPLVKERITNLEEFETMAGFFVEQKDVNKKLFEKDWEVHIQSAFERLGRIKDWKLKDINDSLMNEINRRDYKTGKFFMNLRIAITGSKITPPINESIEILGKAETIKRLSKLKAT